MKIFSISPDVIYSLHRKGFSNDFHLFGNELLWVQENASINDGEYAILEYHKIPGSKYDKRELHVFGIIALYHNVKGILITHNKSDSDRMPPALKKKIIETKCNAGISPGADGIFGVPEELSHLK